METAWTFRIVLIMAFAVIIFGDFLGYGNAKKSDHPHTNDLAIDHQQHHSRALGRYQLTLTDWLTELSRGTRELWPCCRSIAAACGFCGSHHPLSWARIILRSASVWVGGWLVGWSRNFYWFPSNCLDCVWRIRSDPKIELARDWNSLIDPFDVSREIYAKQCRIVNAAL